MAEIAPDNRGGNRFQKLKNISFVIVLCCLSWESAGLLWRQLIFFGKGMGEIRRQRTRIKA